MAAMPATGTPCPVDTERRETLSADRYDGECQTARRRQSFNLPPFRVGHIGFKAFARASILLLIGLVLACVALQF